MTTFIHSGLLRTLLLTTLLLTIFVGGLFLQTEVADAQAATVELELEKKFSGPVPSGYLETQFTFDVSGPDFSVQNVPVTSQNAGFYSALLTLTASGTYMIVENGPTGFVAEDWRVQWSGECDESNSDNLAATLVVDNGNLGDGVQPCRADNQWRPWKLIVEKSIQGTTTDPANFSFVVEQRSTTYFDGSFEQDGENEIALGRGDYLVTENPAPGYTTTYSDGCSGTVESNDSVNKYCLITNTYTGDNGNGGGQTGTLVVEKIVVGGTATATNFSFSVNGSTSTQFEADGSNSLTVASGTYSVLETPVPTGYTASYNNCANLTIASGATVTCIITNTYSTNGGGNGDDDDDEPTYLLFGYVWHDENSNTEWETDEPNPDDDENDLNSWTVQITNGSSTFSTTTDGTGYYYFYVEAGTWTINEVLQDGWTKTFPVVNGHEVVVIDESEEITMTKTSNFFATVMRFFIPIAYAQTPTTYGPYDFGNVFFGTGGGGNGDDDDDDNGSSSGTRTGSRNRNNDNDNALPKPLVLGEATDVMPLGAPNTGAGGTSPVSFGLQIVAVLPSRKTFRY